MAINFQKNEVRDEDDKCKKKNECNECYIANPPKKKFKIEKGDKNEEEKHNLNVLIQITNISEYEKENYIISNAYLRDISFYSKEEEILIFPFTGFEVTGWDNYSFIKDTEEIKGTIFYFQFSKKYKEIIKEAYD